MTQTLHRRGFAFIKVSIVIVWSHLVPAMIKIFAYWGLQSFSLLTSGEDCDSRRREGWRGKARFSSVSRWLIKNQDDFHSREAAVHPFADRVPTARAAAKAFGVCEVSRSRKSHVPRWNHYTAAAVVTARVYTNSHTQVHNAETPLT